MVTVGFGGAVTRELRAVHLLRKVRNCRLILVVVSSTIRSQRVESIAGRMEEKVEVAGVVDEESLVAGRHHVAGLLVATETNLRTRASSVTLL